VHPVSERGGSEPEAQVLISGSVGQGDPHRGSPTAGATAVQPDGSAPAKSSTVESVVSVRAAQIVALMAMMLVALVAERYTRLLRGNISDDAMTSMQYAKNLVEGNGLVFNLGERVEGYTNFLWVMVMAPLYALSKSAAVSFVPLVIHLNVAIAAAVTGLCYSIGSRIWGRWHLATWVSVFLLVVDNAFTTWAVLGLEVHFLALFMLLALLALRSNLRYRAFAAGLLLLAAHLTRPDAALFCACVVGNEVLEVLVAFRKGNRSHAGRALRDTLTISAVWLLPYAAYFAWRYSYYGWFFPNTYYLKLGGAIDGWARGIDYTLDFLRVRSWVPLLGALAVFAVSDKTVRTLLIYVPLHVLYVTYAGGDFMPGHRFFVPELPHFALLVGAAVAVVWKGIQFRGVRRWLSSIGTEPAMVAGFGLASAIGALAFLAARQRQVGPLNPLLTSWGEDHHRQRILMAWLKDKKPRGASFATGLIGHTGFLSDLYVIDVCGIIDPVIAHMTVKDFGHGLPGHEKLASVDYVVSKKPTYIGIYVLPDDLWRYGYYLDADIPPDTVDGVWVRDTLLDRGRYIDGTRIGFDEGPLPGWSALGNAFEKYPSLQSGPGQGRIVGTSGGFINTYHAKHANGATGALRSAPFELVGDQLVFRLAGGRDPARLRVILWVDGKEALSATGPQSDVMARRTWDIRHLRGKMAELQIVDESADAWGYLAVDEIAQWEASAGAGP
jgi:hypothetical protein